MAGTVRRLIDELMELRTRNRPGAAHFVTVHLVLNGIDPDAFDERSPDDPRAIATLEKMISDFRRAE